MPKLTTATAALVIAMASLMVDGPAGVSAGIQNFSVNTFTCYGGAYPGDGTLSCPGTSATIVGTSDSADTHHVTKLDHGSRLTLPVTYTPGSWGFAPGAVGATVGDVSARTDIFCDGSGDILAVGPADAGHPDGAGLSPGGKEASTVGAQVALWPDNKSDGPFASYPSTADEPGIAWNPYPYKHQGAAPAGADAYVATVKSMPSTYVPNSHDKAILLTVYAFGGTTPVFLPNFQNGEGRPLNTITEEVPAAYGADAGLRVSQTLLAGNPNPPSNSFSLCLDSPQDSIARNSQYSSPSAAGLSPRWTVYTSALDIRDGGIIRMIDLACVQVGGPLADTDGDCIEGGLADVPGADSDGDMVVDGIESVMNTDPADNDTDNDGADDFDELFEFTNATSNADTDGDGSADRADVGADEIAGSALQLVDDSTVDDNCPAHGGAGQNHPQVNTDGAPDNNNTPTSDQTNPNADWLGDACDEDDDNDWIDDVAELALYIADAPATSNFCKPNASGTGYTATLSPSNPLDEDTDSDLGFDGAECKFDSNPKSQASKMAVQPNDNLGAAGAEDVQETFYRTQDINKPGGGQEDNPDGDTFLTGVTDLDSDNDVLLDGTEVKFYGTSPANWDTDGDGCFDGAEAASVNGDRKVGSIDISQIAQRFRTGGYDPAVEPSLPTYDFTKDGKINSTDLGRMTSMGTQNCPDAIGVGIARQDPAP